jgi:hypothetical protein
MLVQYAPLYVKYQLYVPVITVADQPDGGNAGELNPSLSINKGKSLSEKSCASRNICEYKVPEKRIRENNKIIDLFIFVSPF